MNLTRSTESPIKFVNKERPKNISFTKPLRNTNSKELSREDDVREHITETSRNCPDQVGDFPTMSQSRIQIEKLHIIVFYVLSCFFLMAAILVKWKQKNSKTYPKHPSLSYLKMRYEASKYFDEKTDQDCETSRFKSLEMLIRE